MGRRASSKPETPLPLWAHSQRCIVCARSRCADVMSTVVKGLRDANESLSTTAASLAQEGHAAASARAGNAPTDVAPGSDQGVDQVVTPTAFNQTRVQQAAEAANAGPAPSHNVVVVATDGGVDESCDDVCRRHDLTVRLASFS